MFGLDYVSPNIYGQIGFASSIGLVSMSSPAYAGALYAGLQRTNGVAGAAGANRDIAFFAGLYNNQYNAYNQAPCPNSLALNYIIKG